MYKIIKNVTDGKDQSIGKSAEGGSSEQKEIKIWKLTKIPGGHKTQNRKKTEIIYNVLILHIYICFKS